jgi:predicted amidohydrolase
VRAIYHRPTCGRPREDLSERYLQHATAVALMLATWVADMKLCVAQTKPVSGDIQTNIRRHTALLDLASGGDVILFPELSLTGYEPTLARQLAIDPGDSRLHEFQVISDSRGIRIGVGVPTRSATGVCITMILFQPHNPRLIYAKGHLHPDEEPFFVSGQNVTTINVDGIVIAPAICYELSVPPHVEKASRGGASVYMTSVAKTSKGLEAAIPTLEGTARSYSMTVLMSNCVGECDGCECAGKTSIWDSNGMLLAQLNDRDEGILMIDTETREITERIL